MEFSIKTGVPEKQKSACVVAGVFEDGTLDTAASRLDKASGKRLSQLIERGDLTGKAGSSLVLHDLPGTACARVLLVGLGKRDDFGDKAYAAAVRGAFKALALTGAEDAVVYLTTLAVGERSPALRDGTPQRRHSRPSYAEPLPIHARSCCSGEVPGC